MDYHNVVFQNTPQGPLGFFRKKKKKTSKKFALGSSPMALMPCRKKDKRIGGMNSLYFSLIHCDYIYTKTNLTFLIDYNSIRQVS